MSGNTTFSLGIPEKCDPGRWDGTIRDDRGPKKPEKCDPKNRKSVTQKTGKV